ncbi:MAG: glycosyltransferase family 4 protein [Halarchaeum sp.]
MRVALVTARTTRHDGAGDAEARLDRLASLLADRAHDVTVFCAQWWEGEPEAFEHEDVTYRAIADAPDDRWSGLRLVSALREYDPDVVHAAGAYPTHVLAARAATALGAPVLTEYYEAPRAGRLDRWAARASDAVVAPSEMVATAVRARGLAEDVAVFPNALEMERVRAVDPDPDAGDIVYSRRLDADANLESLLLALAEFREYDWSATVVGDGPERENYERQASDLRIDDRVTFVGERSLDDRLALFKGAHVYAQTARRTPFATDLLRALACGCVAVVEYHEHSAAHELVEHEPRGFLATSDEELVECLGDARALEREPVDERYADYDENEFLERYLDCYRELGAI